MLSSIDQSKIKFVKKEKSITTKRVKKSVFCSNITLKNLAKQS